MSIEFNKFCIELTDLHRLYRLVLPFSTVNPSVTIVVSEDGLRFVSEDGLSVQIIIYYKVKNLHRLNKSSKPQFIMVKILTADLLDALRGCSYNDTIAKFYYDEEENMDLFRIIIYETTQKLTFDVPATQTITTSAFKEKMSNIPHICTLQSKSFAKGIRNVCEFSSEIKLVISIEGIYFYSNNDGTKFEYNILSKSQNILELTSSYIESYWYSSELLKKLLPYLNANKVCRIKISRSGVLEFKTEFNDHDYSIDSVQIWTAGIHDPDTNDVDNLVFNVF